MLSLCDAGLRLSLIVNSSKFIAPVSAGPAGVFPAYRSMFAKVLVEPWGDGFPGCDAAARNSLCGVGVGARVSILSRGGICFSVAASTCTESGNAGGI
jgi:hypothetical protein